MLIKFKHQKKEVKISFPFFTHMDKEKFRCYSSPTSYVSVDKRACAIKEYSCRESEIQEETNLGWKVSDEYEFSKAFESVLEDTENTLNKLAPLFTAKNSDEDETTEYEGTIR